MEVKIQVVCFGNPRLASPNHLALGRGGGSPSVRPSLVLVMFKKNKKNKTKKESKNGSEGKKRVLLRRKPLVSDVDTAEGDGVESSPVLLWLLDSMNPLHFISSHFWGPQYLHPQAP